MKAEINRPVLDAWGGYFILIKQTERYDKIHNNPIIKPQNYNKMPFCNKQNSFYNKSIDFYFKMM